MPQTRDEKLIAQILNAYENGQISWDKVPELQNLVVEQVQQQGTAQITELNQLYQQKLTHEINTTKIRIRGMKDDLDDIDDKVDSQKTTIIKSWIVEICGLILMILATIAIAWLAVPAILHGVGITPIWHWLHPEFHGWGILRGIIGILISCGIVALAGVAIITPATIAERFWGELKHD